MSLARHETKPSNQFHESFRMKGCLHVSPWTVYSKWAPKCTTVLTEDVWPIFTLYTSQSTYCILYVTVSRSTVRNSLINITERTWHQCNGRPSPTKLCTNPREIFGWRDEKIQGACVTYVKVIADLLPNVPLSQFSGRHLPNFRAEVRLNRRKSRECRAPPSSLEATIVAVIKVRETVA